MTSIPTSTPWGAPQTTTEIAPGIVHIATASHGGYWLSPERVAEMPRPLREFQPWAGPNWYEEDCDWSVVAVAFPQYFPAEAVQAALETIKGYKPDLYEQIAGKGRWAIHYQDRELAREMGDVRLGTVLAKNKEEAEALAGRDSEIARRAMPMASLWAVRLKESEGERAR